MAREEAKRSEELWLIEILKNGDRGCGGWLLADYHVPLPPSFLYQLASIVCCPVRRQASYSLEGAAFMIAPVSGEPFPTNRSEMSRRIIVADIPS